MRGIGSGRGLMPSLLHLFGATRPWQFGDVGRDPPSLIMREYARLPRFVLVFAEVRRRRALGRSRRTRRTLAQARGRTVRRQRF